ncbi:MAG: hypothetical protein A2381_05755 [Bdellovibrionales bacterium RIFOXYB1_FULL_37_110]|nr:MAG: hypothetical protein A2417_06370 [Bdellovibrionales bacterium RIFOXYC1_FULL_37_79]OFZ58555.1 MAG: hypothetical protein A2381_05755 [Bdellovibrionales bacterium RIFOXYB1_FULL_37_110]OFZ63775.1 MAG: hypothetical protein A2577_07505 [Bdellovibrionales bacterium RIFOXYD1_FULL_36_51]
MKPLFLILTAFSLLIITPVFSSYSHNDKIVGGQEANVGAYPWMVALVSSQSSNAHYGQFCGGSLIRPDWVLTAAHCVVDASASNVDLVLGRHNLSDDTVGERIAAKKIIVHNLYDPTKQTNDIALIQLEKPSIQATVKMLDAETEELSNPGLLATVIGYGLLKETAWVGPGKLYNVNVPVVTNSECQASYGEDSIIDSMVCAGYPQGGKDSCQGDSGGPLVVYNSDQVPHLTGVVSWGQGCARPNFYGVYTRVSNFVDWVNNNISNE